MMPRMAEQKRKGNPSRSRGEGTADLFTRIKVEEAEEFGRLVDAMVPKTSRSAVIAMLIRQWVAEQRQKQS